MAADRISRGQFLQRTAAGTAGLGIGWSVPEAAAAEQAALSRTPLDGPVPTRTLGKTGEPVSMMALGGWTMGRIPDERTALRTVATALDVGITFMDTAHSYQDGVSEERYGRALHGKRDQVFLASKSTARTREASQAELDLSLRRLQTDRLDLWQFHSIKTVEDVETIFGPDGALETAKRAQAAGKIRYIGITGHFDPAAHQHALQYHAELDTMLMPLNLLDPHRLSFVRDVLPGANRHHLGVTAIKTCSNGRIVEHSVATVHECLRYAWSLPISVIISGCDSPEHVILNSNAAKAFTPMSEGEQADLLARTAPLWSAEVEYYKKTV